MTPLEFLDSLTAKELLNWAGAIYSERQPEGGRDWKHAQNTMKDLYCQDVKVSVAYLRQLAEDRDAQ